MSRAGWGEPIVEAPPVRTVPGEAPDTTRVLLDVVRAGILVRAGERITPELASERAANLVMAIVGLFEVNEMPEEETAPFDATRRA